ncbi:hypothetical protein U6G28_04640 [Actinomycetaceae bacterium MB13-C1-2]|nr:hypothetical protein U6G28_04640 [Actinomycetaceae bacterium MB13-C1-2]
MPPSLREPLTHSNWVWLLGVALLTVAILWVLGVYISYRKSRVMTKFEVRSLSQVQRERYRRLIGEVEQDYQTGAISAREAHLALAALIRASATERTRMSVESATASEARTLLPSWPLLADALDWCADGSFPLEIADERVERGIWLAREVAVG